MKLNWDLVRGLPKDKTSWPIWLGDHYQNGNFNVPQIIYILISEFKRDIDMSIKWLDKKGAHTEVCKMFEENDEVWRRFCRAADLSAEDHFEHKVCDIVSGFGTMLKQYREN